MCFCRVFWFVCFCSVLAYVSAPVSDVYGCSNVDCASVCSLRMCRQSLCVCVLLSSAAYIIIKGHRADGSLILDTDRIKLPQTTDSKSSEVLAEPSPRSKLESYRDCGRCRKPEAKLKCACLATHYCDTRCQREDMPDHRRECTHMILKDVQRIQHQLDKHRTNHGQFTIEVARQELVLTETHVKLADILRS